MTEHPDLLRAPLPGGDYCILELFGHVTLVGRYREAEQFGVKMLAIEPLFRDMLLPVVFHGGAAIYRLTPVEPVVARAHQPMAAYLLPPAIKALVPLALLPPDRAPAPDYRVTGFHWIDEATDIPT